MNANKTLKRFAFHGASRTVLQCSMVLGLSATIFGVACDSESTEDLSSWEEFRDNHTYVVEEGAPETYIVGWDTVVSLEQLRDYYEESVIASPDGFRSVVIAKEVPTGSGRLVPSVWSPEEALDLKYCVSDEWKAKGEKSRVVQEMADAAAAWEAVGNVDFKYRWGHDYQCDGDNPFVDFAVRPSVDIGACAPIANNTYASCGNGGTVYLNFDIIARMLEGAPNATSTGIIRHELGHVLGLLHEHARPDASQTECDHRLRLPNIRGTEYDRDSVMHYLHCGGDMTKDLTISPLDAWGIQMLYP